jgi:hypothetical protein
VLALVGPSGSGKTTLLSVLGGRPPKLLEWEGRVLVNGRPLTKAGRRRIGYVLQVGRAPGWPGDGESGPPAPGGGEQSLAWLAPGTQLLPDKSVHRTRLAVH